MSDNSAIEWTDATWNPVTGCTEVSPGCDNCYAKTFAERWRGTPGHHFENGFDVTLRPERIDQPLRWKKPRKVFVNSMSDLFHEAIPDEFIAEVFATMAKSPRHTYQVLTKRHGRMRSLLKRLSFRDNLAHLAPWPLPNVWLGVSVEDQKRADIRIPALLNTPAAVRFLSCEPLLGPVDLEMVDWDGATGLTVLEHPPNGIDWVIVGGESGPGARPMDPAWARQLRDQCQAASVPFHFKQWGAFAPSGVVGLGRPFPGNAFVGEPVNKDGFRTEMTRVGKGKAGRILDGRTWDEFPQAVTA
jgi:protein gp37